MSIKQYRLVLSVLEKLRLYWIAIPAAMKLCTLEEFDALILAVRLEIANREK